MQKPLYIWMDNLGQLKMLRLCCFCHLSMPLSQNLDSNSSFERKKAKAKQLPQVFHNNRCISQQRLWTSLRVEGISPRCFSHLQIKPSASNPPCGDLSISSDLLPYSTQKGSFGRTSPYKFTHNIWFYRKLIQSGSRFKSKRWNAMIVLKTRFLSGSVSAAQRSRGVEKGEPQHSTVAFFFFLFRESEDVWFGQAVALLYRPCLEGPCMNGMSSRAESLGQTSLLQLAEHRPAASRRKMPFCRCNDQQSLLQTLTLRPNWRFRWQSGADAAHPINVRSCQTWLPLRK